MLCVCWVIPNFWENALIAEKKIKIFFMLKNDKTTLLLNVFFDFILKCCIFKALALIELFNAPPGRYKSDVYLLPKKMGM